MSKLISLGNVNQEGVENLGKNGEEFFICFEKSSIKLEKDHLLAPVANKKCLVHVKDVYESVDKTTVSVVLLDEDKRAWIPEEYLSLREYWVKLGHMVPFETNSTHGSIQFAE